MSIPTPPRSLKTGTIIDKTLAVIERSVTPVLAYVAGLTLVNGTITYFTRDMTRITDALVLGLAGIVVGIVAAYLLLEAAVRRTGLRSRTDGDVFLPEEQVRGFEVVGCVECGGVLKPDVVFFGENVPRPRVEQCYSLVDNARSLLVLGSSLTVMSGLRFVRRAADAGIPVVIINRGVTRGDPYASLRVDLPLGKSLTELADVVLQSGNGDLPGR